VYWNKEATNSVNTNTLYLMTKVLTNLISYVMKNHIWWELEAFNEKSVKTKAHLEFHESVIYCDLNS